MKKNTKPAELPNNTTTTDYINLTWMSYGTDQPDEYVRLFRQAWKLYLETGSPETTFLNVGPHLFYVYKKQNWIVDARDFQTLNNILRELRLLPPDQQLTKSMHFALVRVLEHEELYLEGQLLKREEVDQYRRLLEVMHDKVQTMSVVREILEKLGEEILYDDGPICMSSTEWQLDLIEQLADNCDESEPLEEIKQ